MGQRRAAAVVAAVTLWWLTGCAGAVWLELATTATKCLSEEIQSNVIVIADYSILFEEHPIRPKLSAKGVALELVKLEVAAKAIHENLLYLILKEADLRDLSEWTQVKITWLSLISLAVCIAVSVLQLWHLKQFFRKKKLI